MASVLVTLEILRLQKTLPVVFDPALPLSAALLGAFAALEALEAACAADARRRMQVGTLMWKSLRKF